MNKEEIYDEKISPLMGQIIAICREHKIAMFATYNISNDDDGLRCTTCLGDETGKVSDAHAQCQRAVGSISASPMMLTTQHADGSKTLTAILG